MFAAFETALRQHLADVIPGAPVYGTLDEPDLETHALYVQVAWLGYRLNAQSPGRGEASLLQTFAVRIGAGAGALDGTQTTAAADGLAAVLRRILGFTYGDRPGRLKPTLIDPPPPAYQGAAVELAVYFTLPGVATAHPAQE